MRDLSCEKSSSQEGTMNTVGAWKLVAGLALCGMAATGCGTHHEVLVNSTQAPQSIPASRNKPAVTLLRIEDAIPDPNYQADPAFLGEPSSGVGTFFVFPVWGYYRFHGAHPRAELVQSAFLAKLQSSDLPIRYQSEGRFEQFTNRKDGHLVISVRLKKFQVDTGFSIFLPLVVVNVLDFNNIKSHVVLECQVRQPGNSTPLWQGTVEGRTESGSESQDRVSKPLKTQNAIMDLLIQQAIMGAVEQFVQTSNIQQLSLQARNEAYAKHVMASQEREAAGDWKGRSATTAKPMTWR